MAARKPVARGGKPTPTDDARTIAHHLDSAGFNLAHGTRHAAEAAKATGAAAKFNAAHATKHLGETKASLEKLGESIAKKVPAVGPETKKLQQAKAQPQVKGKSRAR